MLSMVHLKDEVEPAKAPLTVVSLSYDVMEITKHTIMGTIQWYFDYHEVWRFEICHQNVVKYDTLDYLVLPQVLDLYVLQQK